MASFPSNGYSEVMSGTNNYTGSNFYGSSCPKTPIVPVSNDDLTNKLYVDTATGGGIIGNLTDKGSLITGDGTQAVIFDQNPYQTALTTSTVYDWNALAIGQSRVFSTPNVLLIPLGADITITYSGTDSITGILTAITAYDITITITAFASAVYTSTTLYNSNPYVTYAGSDIDPDFFFLSPPSAFTSSLIVTNGLTGIYSAPSNVPYTIDILTSAGSVLLGSSVPGVSVAPSTPSSFTYTEGVYIPNGQAFYINFNTAGNPVNWGLVLGGSLSQPFSYFGTIDGYTLPYSSGSIVLNDTIGLVADPISSTGLAWGIINTASIGAVTSVSGGTNIVMSGTIATPIVNLRNPLTAELNMGAQSFRDSASAVGTSGQILSAGTGGQTLWTAATVPTVVSAGTNISVTGTASAPIVNLLNPLTAQLNMGTQSLRDSASAVGTSGQILSAGTGGQTLWTAATVPTVVSAGTNISVTGTASAPIVNLLNPLTAQLNMGTQSLRDSASAVGTSGQILSAGTGGQTLWTAATVPTVVSAGTNISVTGTASAPIVNLLNPLTAQLNMGTQSLRDSASAVGTSGQILTAGTGGQTLWTAAPSTNPTITNTNTNATYYPTFVAGAGSQPLLADISTGPISLNPSNGNFNVVSTLKLTQAELAIGLNAGGSGQGTGSVAIGLSAGQTNQGGASVAIGSNAGATNQGGGSFAIGGLAGFSNQGAGCIAIGASAGQTSQTAGGIAIGNSSGTTTQGNGAVALGGSAGNNNQGASAVAVGTLSGNANQGAAAVAIGLGAGSGLSTGQGANAIAIGNLAGYNSQTAGSICLNATGVAVNPSQAGFFVAPIRNLSTISPYNLQYDSTTDEVVSFLNDNNIIMEDFASDGGNAAVIGNNIPFAETGTGSTTFYTGTIEPAILNGSLYRKGIVQLNSGGSGSSMMISDIMFSYANVSKITFGLVPHGNQALSTATVAAGNIIQTFGLTSAATTAGTNTSNTVMWRLSSASATIPSWQFVINNVVQFTLSITPTDMTAKWCRVEINIVYGGASTATVSSTWYNLTDGTSQTTGTYTITAGTGFSNPLTTPNTAGIQICSFTSNATNKYLGVDYVEVQQPNLYPVGSGTTDTTGR